MKSLATILFAAGIAAQPPCSLFEMRRFGGTPEWFPHISANSLRVEKFAHVEAVPTGRGIGLLFLFYQPETLFWYSDPKVWTETSPGCDNGKRYLHLATYWNDVDNQPRAGDTMVLFGREPAMSLAASPAGVVWADRYMPHYGVPYFGPLIERQQQPAHWNAACNRPLYWAVLIVPEGGQW